MTGASRVFLIGSSPSRGFRDLRMTKLSALSVSSRWWFSLAAAMILGAAACDSIHISTDPLPTGASKVAQVEAWYEEALVQTQERALGKFSNAEVL